MRKLYIFLILALFVNSINAQEKRILLKGKTLLDSLRIANVHIVNKNTAIGTISNNDGSFEIPVKVGDSLYLSHINLESNIILITAKIIFEKKITFILKEKVYALNEITLEKPKSIFFEDENIGEYNGPNVNAKTLRLPYAGTKVKKNSAIVSFRSGGVVRLDNLINNINGTKRREKLLAKMVSEDDELSKIRAQFSDDFFITDLKIKKEYINPFLNFCLDNNIINISKSDNVLKLTRLLIKQSKTFPHKILNEGLFLTKK